jgi:hypothetical protein
LLHLLLCTEKVLLQRTSVSPLEEALILKHTKCGSVCDCKHMAHPQQSGTVQQYKIAALQLASKLLPDDHRPRTSIMKSELQPVSGAFVQSSQPDYDLKVYKRTVHVLYASQMPLRRH